MTQTHWHKLAKRLNPQLNNLEGAHYHQGLAIMLVSAYMAPYVLISLLWLWQVGLPDPAGFQWILLALLVAFVIVPRQPFVIKLTIGQDTTIRASSSLLSLLRWSALLIFGAPVLWLLLVAFVVDTLLAAWEQRRYGQEAFWDPLAYFSQSTGDLLATLIALTAYRLLGGAIPMASYALVDWLPAVAAIWLESLLVGLIIVPIIILYNRVSGTPSDTRTLATFYFSAVSVNFVTTPFAILGTLLYVFSGQWAYLGFVLGIVLVNLQAHYLSRANARSEQRARELARLEALGEALIRSPADLSGLQGLLTEHVNDMFPDDRLEIRLGSGAQQGGRPDRWPSLNLRAPAHEAPLPESAWDALPAAPESHYFVRRLLLPGIDKPYGDAVVARIIFRPPQEKEGGSSTGGDASPADEPIAGGVCLLRRGSEGRVDDSLPAIQSLASQIESALYRAEVHRQTLAHQKIAQELAFAGQIQHSFLPAGVPSIPGWDIAADLVAARETSGDFYDFVPLHGGRIGVIVADVADKGTGAALFMAMSRTLLRTFAVAHPESPAQALRATNQRILADSASDQFVTVFYGILAPDSGRLHYANAGHNPAFVVNGGEPAVLARTGIPLGMFDHLDWTEHEVDLAPGDLLLMYTDGVSEAQDEHESEFGTDRLLNVARGHHELPAAEIQVAILEAVDSFVAGAPQMDDITLMVAVRQLDVPATRERSDV